MWDYFDWWIINILGTTFTLCFKVIYLKPVYLKTSEHGKCLYLHYKFRKTLNKNKTIKKRMTHRSPWIRHPASPESGWLARWQNLCGQAANTKNMSKIMHFHIASKVNCLKQFQNNFYIKKLNQMYYFSGIFVDKSERGFKYRGVFIK